MRMMIFCKLVIVFSLFCYSSALPSASAKTPSSRLESDEDVNCIDFAYHLADLYEEGEYEKILEIVVPALKKGESYSEYYRMAGIAYFYLNEFDKSLNALTKTYKSDTYCIHMPKKTIALEKAMIKNEISIVHKRLGQHKKSKEAYKRAVKEFSDTMGEDFDEEKMRYYFGKVFKD